MTTNFLKGILIIGTTLALLSFDLPTGWFSAGSKPQSYEMGIDRSAGQNSKNSGTIKSNENTIEGFGTLMQNFSPDKYIGKRIRLTGMLKTKDVSSWAGLWLRIDTKTPIKAVVFDNMHDGKKDMSVKGTTDWTKYEIVLDVPYNASNIAFGALLGGTGQIWFDNLNFEIVTPDILTTGIEMETKSSTYAASKKEPVNLDFEK
ncbi:MAG TPA: hypothetical protein VFC67_21085 [Prolixibacteraceae bacterium]|nr:hypothetical protein [Prolixibacteraceae bacterium]